MSDDMLQLSFKDIKGANLNTFTRIVQGTSKYIFKDGELIIKELLRKTNYMTKLTADKKKTNNFLTLDLETFNLNSKLTPYCASIFNGIFHESFYLTDFKNPNAMLKSCLRSIFVKGNHGATVYCHNLTGFESVFLLKVISSFKDFKVLPIFKNGKVINIKVSFGKNYVNFRDSLLILPVSLRKLAIAFNIENKGIFPYNFVTNNNLNYVGPVPAFHFFSDITKEAYDNYCLAFTNDN